MAEPTSAVPTAPPDPARPSAPGVGRRLLRGLLAPARFARRRPARAALYLALFVLVALAAAAAGVWVWFDHHLEAARAELRRGHHAAAVRHLRNCQRVHAEGHDVLLLSARAARVSGAWDEADALLTRYSELYGDDEPAVLERLLLRAARGEVDAVAPQLAARIATGGEPAALAREALVTGLIYRFRWADASRQLQAWAEQEPDSTAALLLRGKLEEQRQGFEVAIGLYRRILEIDPDHDEARLRLSTQLLATRRGGEALPHLEVLRRHLPDHPEVMVQWAQALALLGHTGESRAALDECLRKHPDYPAALLEHGSALLVEGEEAEAEREFARAVRLDPGNLVARDRYAFALARNGKPEEAARARAEADRLKADLEQITTLVTGRLQNNPRDPDVHYQIGAIALRSGLVAEAIRWFESALQVDPDHLPTHRTLALLYRELDNPVLSARHRALAQRSAERVKQ